MTRPESVVDLPLWRLLKRVGVLRRRRAPLPPAIYHPPGTKIIPFRRAGHRRRPSRRNPQ